VNVPPSLLPLVDDGIIEEVVRPLMSGKEAQVFLVVAGGRERVAKVYKDAARRSFKHKSDYTEGRRTRNTRDQRAMAQRTKHGRSQDEAAWRSTEVDMIYRLRAAGVRVPEPYIFSDGVLVMEFITNGDGLAAPRLGDAAVSPDEAVVIFETLMQEVIRMLCAGVVHGDLSDFNVLLSDTGPVVIDFPQAMDAAGNRNARNILIRDVDNLHRFLERATRGYRPKPFAQEMWALFERGELLPDTKLKGLYRPDSKAADMGGLLRELQDAKRDAVRAGLAVDDEPGAREDERGDAAGGAGAGGPRRRVEVVMGRGGQAAPREAQGPRGGQGPGGRSGGGPGARGPGAPEGRRDASSRGAPRSRCRMPGAGRADRTPPPCRHSRHPSPCSRTHSVRWRQESRRPRATRRLLAPSARSSRSGQCLRARHSKASAARTLGRASGPLPSAPPANAQRHKGDERAAPPRDARAAAPKPVVNTQAAAVEGGEGAAKRRRRRRRGRSGGASSEPAA
jgi:RIO kinase 1